MLGVPHEIYEESTKLVTEFNIDINEESNQPVNSSCLQIQANVVTVLVGVLSFCDGRVREIAKG